MAASVLHDQGEHSLTTVAVLQPGYLPWLGFFHQLWSCSHFVYYDDVQYDRNGWRNRNRIKASNGPLWLTVPVLQNGRFGQTIRDVEIDNKAAWPKKHMRSLRQSYVHAPFKEPYLSEFEELISKPWRYLCDLDIAITEMMIGWLGLKRSMHRSSELGIGGGRSERLLAICQHLGAGRYFSGAAAKVYLDVPLFQQFGIAVEFQDYHHPVYPQQWGEFIPYLSTLDLILNVGPDSLALLVGAKPSPASCSSLDTGHANV